MTHTERLRGFTTRRTPSGWSFGLLHHFADPTRDNSEYIHAASVGMDAQQRSREIFNSWESAAGSSFYPEYQLFGGHKTHVRRATALLRDQPIRRGWDFGPRHPACVWAQYDPATDRDWILRTLMPPLAETDGYHNAYTFRDLVLWLSGQLPYEALSTAVRERIRAMEMDPVYGKLPMPWFATLAHPFRWLDFSGTEANNPATGIAENSDEVVQADILASRGVYLTQHYGAVASGSPILRRLLMSRPDGLAGVLLDPMNEELIEGLSGAIVYQEPTKEQLIRDRPKKDGYFEHPHEAYLYSLVSVVPLDAPHGYQVGDPMPSEGPVLQVLDRSRDAGGFDIMENRPDVVD